MGTTKYLDLANVLRSRGLKVVEVSGWKTRSSNWSKGFAPNAIVCHHTAGPVAGGNYPSYDTVLNGRGKPGTSGYLAGPLAQFGLGRDGTVYIFGGHRANHAGVGGPLIGIPKDSANAYAWGIEAENSGSQAWPAVQMQAYYRLCAALAVYNGFSAARVIGHKEWAPGRKPDPSFDMNAFRAQVAKAIDAFKAPTGGGVTTPPVAPRPAPALDNLGNPKMGTGPYDGRWTRGPIPKLPLYLYDVYLMVAHEDGRYGRALDSFQLAHQAKVIEVLDYLVRLKGQKPYRSLVNLIKQVQILWFGYNSNTKNYGLFDRKLLDLFIKRQGWTFWDGPRG